MGKTLASKHLVNRKSKLGTWYRMDGAWHLIRKTQDHKLRPGGLILDKTWELGARMKDYQWELELWREANSRGSDGCISYIPIVSLGKFDTLKEGMNFADDAFSAFL
jgi:hypothetical protein